MMKNIKKHKKISGFTLIEVIVVIVITGFLATLLFTLSQMTSTTPTPVIQSQNLYLLREYMETITGEYHHQMEAAAADPLGNLKTYINNNYGAYAAIPGSDPENVTDGNTGITYRRLRVTLTMNNQTVSAIFTAE